VRCDDNGIYAQERYEFDVGFGKGYDNVQPFGSRDWALDRNIIDLAVVLSFISLDLEIYVGASGDSVNGSKGQEIGVSLGRFYGLRRWWKCIGL
jgi:hypothetical protein